MQNKSIMKYEVVKAAVLLFIKSSVTKQARTQQQRNEYTEAAVLEVDMGATDTRLGTASNNTDI